MLFKRFLAPSAPITKKWGFELLTCRLPPVQRSQRQLSVLLTSESTCASHRRNLHALGQFTGVTSLTKISTRSLFGFGSGKQASVAQDAVTAAAKPSDVLFVPPPPEINPAEMAARLASEPSFAELGLGASWSPSGLLQLGLEAVHNLGVPWWATVLLLTVAIRSALFPAYIISRRAMIQLQNSAPQIQELNERFTRARAGGNALETAVVAHELSDLMRNRSSWRAYLMIIVQVPTFLTVFTALRGMCAAGVPSLQSGGLLWFTDLSMPDPYYALPVITSLTLLITFELGAEGVSASMWRGNRAKWLLRAIAAGLIPATAFFPSCMTMYWLTNNVISLALSRVLSLPQARRALSLPELDSSAAAMNSAHKTARKGIGESLRESYQNARVGSSLVDRARNAELEWRDAALKPAVRTYAENPLLRANTKKAGGLQQPKRSIQALAIVPKNGDAA